MIDRDQTAPAEVLAGDARSPLARAIAQLEAQRVPARPNSKTRRILLRAIKTVPEVFDIRGCEPDDYHIGQLAKLLDTKDDLSPVLVMPVGNGFVIVDGHARLAAYRKSRRKDVPAEVFTGPVRDAVLEAVSRNAVQIAPLDNQQRQDCAWRLVLAGYTIRQVVGAAGISRTQVGNMRRAMKSLGEEATQHLQWWTAMRAAEGGEELSDMDDDQREAWLQSKVEALAGKLKGAGGPNLHQNPEITGRALALLLGRKAPEVVEWIMNNLTPEAQEQEAERLAFTDDPSPEQPLADDEISAFY